MAVNSGADKGFQAYLEEEIKKSKGQLVPVKASTLERRFVKTVPIGKIHPNPDDEFCMPSVGARDSAISKYVLSISRNQSLGMPLFDEPLMVEKVHPDGYMLLNGHHRWAAAWQVGVKKLPVTIVNLTQETDIAEMLKISKHDKRVTLDLDEVVFCEEGCEFAEEPLKGLAGRNFPERIRQGVPSLLHLLTKYGYDIWVYTAQFYSYDYLRAYFKRYSVRVDGIITGTARKRDPKAEADAVKRTKDLFEAKYSETIHIDNDMVLRTFRNSDEFEEYEIKCSQADWANSVINVIEKIRKYGK